MHTRLDPPQNHQFWTNFTKEYDTPLATKFLINPKMLSNPDHTLAIESSWIMAHFDQYMLPANYPIVEFGAGCGINLLRFSKTHKISAWDFSPPAIKFLQKLPDAKIEKTRLIDLNRTEETGESTQLSYQSELLDDLTTPATIFCVNTLQHLNPIARNLLIFSWIETAKKRSVFFLFSNEIIGLSEHEDKKFKDQLESKSLDENAVVAKTFETSRLQRWIHEKGKLPLNFILSFFGARTDCEVLHVSHHMREKLDPNLPNCLNQYKEKLVIRKI